MREQTCQLTAASARLGLRLPRRPTHARAARHIIRRHTACARVTQKVMGSASPRASIAQRRLEVLAGRPTATTSPYPLRPLTTRLPISGSPLRPRPFFLPRPSLAVLPSIWQMHRPSVVPQIRRTARTLAARCASHTGNVEKCIWVVATRTTARVHSSLILPPNRLPSTVCTGSAVETLTDVTKRAR